MSAQEEMAEIKHVLQIL